MKLPLKILLISAVLSTLIPCQELYELVQTDSVEHNCCSGELPNDENQNTCTPLCHCFNMLTLHNITLKSMSLEVKFIHYQTHLNKFTEEQTEPVFRPPIA